MTITLYKFGPQWGIADPSPFCLKLESYLRMADIDYVAPEFEMSFFKMAPKGKFPYVKTSDGKIIGDSNFIIDYLIAQGERDLDAGLSVEEKSISTAFQRLMDENLYWVLIYSRWKDEPGWSVISEIFFGDIPKPIRFFIQTKAAKGIWGKALGHGMGLHSHEEIYQIGKKDLQALSDYLGNKTYFFGGDSPTLIDLTLHGYVINFIEAPIDSPLKASALEKDNLVKHARLIQDMIYGESVEIKKVA